MSPYIHCARFRLRADDVVSAHGRRSRLPIRLRLALVLRLTWPQCPCRRVSGLYEVALVGCMAWMKLRRDAWHSPIVSGSCGGYHGGRLKHGTLWMDGVSSFVTLEFYDIGLFHFLKIQTVRLSSFCIKSVREVKCYVSVTSLSSAYAVYCVLFFKSSCVQRYLSVCAFLCLKLYCLGVTLMFFFHCSQ